MITKTLRLKINSSHALRVAFDVGKTTLDLYFEIPNAANGTVEATTGALPNRPRNILSTLGELEEKAQSHGYRRLFITCESTGAYSEKLLKLARQRGHLTAYVSGESVHKAKVIENNDAGKTDTKDPRVILMLSQMDRVLHHRPLSGAYLALRELNRAYDTERLQVTSAKGQCHALLTRLFCDLECSSQFLYQKTGQALFQLYRFNPYRIVAEGQVNFEKAMRKHASGIHAETLRKLWDNAQSSSLMVQEEPYLKAMEFRLKGFWEHMALAESRLAELKEQMVALYDQLAQEGELVPPTCPGFLSAFRISRILGETGPLRDFKTVDALMKFAGLNLRERKSGQYTGQVHLSKKGRSPLRAVLGEAVFGMVRKSAAYGSYYHAKKAKGMPGTKIMAVIERKLLKAFFAMGLKGAAFDQSRLGVCESQYKMVA